MDNKTPKINCSYDNLVSFEDIKPHPKNPNTHSDEQIERLAKIIEYQGQRSPVVIDRKSGFIVVGHGRASAIKKIGWDKIAVNYQDFDSEEQLYAHMTADNAIAEWATLDLSLINTELENMPDLDLDLLGLKDFEAIAIEELDPQTDEDEVPGVIDPITKRGDIWLLGNHRVMCGDSTMIDDVERLMAGEKAELVFTDPPYRMQAEGGSNQLVGKAARKLGEAIKHLCEFDPVAFLNILPTVFEKNKMNSYIFCNKDLVPDYLQWAIEAGYSFNILVWKKPNAIPLGGSHRPDIEYLLLFRKGATWNNGVEGANYSKCLEYGRVSDKQETMGHPTPKPVELIDNEILISSNKGKFVLDLFNGSGSTLLSCEKNKRFYMGMEMDEKFVDATIKRWQNYTGKEATLESTGETYNSLKANQDGAA